MNATTPFNNIFYEYLTLSPTFKTAVPTPTQKRLQSSQIFADTPIEKSMEAPKERAVPKRSEEKLDLNKTVAELVSGFRNTPATKSEEIKHKDTKHLADNRETDDFSERTKQLYFSKKSVSAPTTSRFGCNRRFVSTNTTEENYSENSENSGKPKRWGKEEDKLMFSHLNRLAQSHDVDIDELSNPESMSEPNHYKMLLTLKREMCWVGTTRQILKRICILKKNKHLSVRDKRALRRLVHDQVARKNPDFEKILYEFP